MSDKENEKEEDDVLLEPLAEDGEELSGKDVVKKLRERLAKCEAERKEYLEGWQRMKADYVNSRKEEEKRIAFAEAKTAERIILDVLPIVDSFEMAMGNNETWENVDPNWRKGVEYIYVQLVEVLRRYGIEHVGSAGERFNPDFHQALETVPVTEVEKDDVVLDVIQRGYRMNGNTIRPAKVKVGMLVST